ncbi:hypothetical protein OQA88_5306 [Cercophora sp. LCS_1]
MKLRLSLALVLWAASSAAVETVSLSSLSNDLKRAESVREIKNVQKSYAQYAAHGLWTEMGALFAGDGVLRWGQGKPGADILSSSDMVEFIGPNAIANFLRSDAGNMDGIKPGSLHALINDMPVITLAADGKSARGRWHYLRFLGDGAGQTKIQGGIMENRYVLRSAGAGKGDRWLIQFLRYYPLFEGSYRTGWRNVGNNSLPIIPYHFTPDQAGIPIPTGQNISPASAALTVDELKFRISRLNDEDDVRNLNHAAGHYVDRRMWPDVVDLFAVNGTVAVDGRVSAPGAAGIQATLERMGPAGLTRGILNDHPIYQTTVEVSPSGLSATSRGLEIGMIGDSNAKTAEWQFCVFNHHFVKDPATNIWKIQQLSYTRLVVANYTAGWATGGILAPRNITVPPFPNLLGLVSNTTQKPEDWIPTWRENTNSTETLLLELQRRLSRSTAWDETENISSAYGWWIDDVSCWNLANIHASKGFKLSPGVGWYRTPERIGGACAARYGNGTGAARGSIPFHWRTQPVILVSEDGKSATTRIRNLQIGTSKGNPGGFNGGMYHDQFVLEEKDGVARRKLWSLTIDEFYWNSGSWASGWAGVNSTALGRRTVGHGFYRRQQGIGGFVADVSLTDPGHGPREVGFMGGPPPTVRWPDIQRMWWAYRNPVSGRLPESYWPGCVPCKAKPDWALTANGFQEPATGPTKVTAKAQGLSIVVEVEGGPDEPVRGVVQLRKGNRSSNLMGEVELSGSGEEMVVFSVARDALAPGENELAVFFLGSDRLNPGRASVAVNVPGAAV